MSTYVRYLLDLAKWGVHVHGNEPFGDRVSHSLFGDRIAKLLLDAGLIEPYGTTRLGDPAYRPTEIA